MRNIMPAVLHRLVLLKLTITHNGYKFLIN